MNQGKLEVVKQEMARVNFDILGISKLKSLTALPMCITGTRLVTGCVVWFISV